MAKVIIMDHPLIQHKIGMIRRIETGTKDFRQTIGEIASLICYEATRNLKLADVEIETNGSVPLKNILSLGTCQSFGMRTGKPYGRQPSRRCFAQPWGEPSRLLRK